MARGGTQGGATKLPNPRAPPIARAGGYGALEADTKWSDIIPRQSPGVEFDRFYGPSWSQSGTDVVGEAIETLGGFLGEARRSSRVRSPSASKEV